MGFSLAWILTLSLSFGALGAGWLIRQGTEAEGLAEALPALLYRPEVLATFTVIQFAGLLGVTVATIRFLRWDLPATLALRGASGPAWVGAFLGGFATLWFAAGVAQMLLSAFPSLESEALLQLGRAFEEGSPIARGALTLAVAVAAPIVEELLFRGALWSALRRVLSGPAVLVVTTLLFAAYHMDPLHSATVFTTGLMLGWLRLATGSVLPGILLHAVNNAAAAAILLRYGADGGDELSALGFVGAGVALAGAALFIRRGPVGAGPAGSEPGDPAPPAPAGSSGSA